MADSNRAMQCRRLLSNLSEESKQAKLKLVQCDEKRTSLTQEISSIESRLAALQEEFQRKQLLVANAKKEYQDCSVRIEYNEAKKIGLCIRSVIVANNHSSLIILKHTWCSFCRTLEKKTLSNVLSYLGKGSEAYVVCKYWKSLMDDLSNR